MVSAFKISILALAVTTWTFMSFIYSSRPEDGEANVLANLMELPSRFPASLPSAMKFEPKKKKIEPIEMSVVEFSCAHLGEAGDKVSARWVRLAGQDCGKVDAEKMTVRNLSNGYTATVFAVSKKAMTTDFIPLVIGENRISLSLDNRHGETEEKEFQLTRE